MGYLGVGRRNRDNPKAEMKARKADNRFLLQAIAFFLTFCLFRFLTGC